MVHASIRMLISAGKRNEVLGILRSFAQQTRFDQGCIMCRIYRDSEIPEGILLDEIWSDDESLKNHLRSPEFRNVLLVSELASAPPEFRFEKILQSTGIETIEMARIENA